MHSIEYLELKSLLVEIRDKVTALAEAAQKELLTPAEVCKMLKIGRTTYQRYVADGIFEEVRISGKSGGKVYVKRSEILKRMDEGKL